jgi:hypothetical protein
MSNPGFLLAEDAAIKKRFTGLKVSDDRNATRPVKVYFRYPDNETEREYPFITIELIDVVYAQNRQHSMSTIYGSTNSEYPYTGSNALTYWPSTQSNFNGASTAGPLVWTEDFLPVDLMYQVSTFCRSALHDRQLTSLIMSRVARFRFGSIRIPEDGTARRFDLLDWITADLLDPEAGYRKRIFRKVYTIQMSAELTVSDYASARRVSKVIADTIVNNTTTETVTIT